MAIPSGSGTEILTRTFENANSDAWATVIDGANANHIYTLISLVWCNLNATDETIGLRVYTSTSAYIQILNEATPLPANGTYIFNDKLCLVGTDELQAYNTAGNVDIYCSYIFQNWQ